MGEGMRTAPRRVACVVALREGLFPLAGSQGAAMSPLLVKLPAVQAGLHIE